MCALVFVQRPSSPLGEIHMTTLSKSYREDRLCLSGAIPLRERVAHGGETVGFSSMLREVPTRTNGTTV